MQKGMWILVIVLVVMILLSIAAVSGLYFLFQGVPEVQKGTVVEIAVRESISDLPTENPVTQLFGFDLNLWEIGRALEMASRDDAIAGVYLEIHPLLLSWGQIEELRDFVREFRKSGKPVHALLAVDLLGEKELYLASAANSITVNPDAGFLVNGLTVEVTFYQKSLEKLGIEPQFLQFKEYKSAEQYSRSKLSPQMREMYESLLKDLQDRFVQSVARERSVTEARLRNLIATGIGSAQLALEGGIVDALGYRDQIDAKFAIPEKTDGKYPTISIPQYLKAAPGRSPGTKHKVALIGGFGLIVAGQSDPFGQSTGGITLSSRLREIRKDEGIKGVILRVNSPGGSAVGSDIVWREITLLEQANKPVVVSMSGVAGSGGYYISMGARRIVSQPSTITGSIGVIFGKFNVRGLYDWLGISVDRVKLGPNADIFSPVTSLTREQKKQVESWMSTIYEAFVRKAAEGRKMTYSELEPKAHGRIYTGAQAKALGLVDELGGLRVAVEQMKEALDLKEEEEIELILYPKRKSVWELFRSGKFLAARQPPSLRQWLQGQISALATPAPWLLMPEIQIN